MDRSVNHMKS